MALHVLIAGLLLVQLPPLDFSPPQEETVTIEMVPPPEEEEKAEEAEQEQALNVSEMEEQAPQEEQRPPPEEQQAAEPAQAAGGEPPPPAAEAQEGQAAEPPQQAEAAEPPPPPPAETETAEAAEPPPEAPPAEEQQSAQPPEAEPPAQEQAEASQAGSETPGSEEAGEQEAGRGQPLPTLRPVFEYGEEASGSGMARGGNASEGEEAEESETADLQEGTQPNAIEPAETDEAVTGAPVSEGEAEPAAPNLPDDIETPSVDMNGALPLPSSEEAAAEGTQLAAEPAPGTADGEATPEDAEAKPAEPSEDSAQDAAPRPARRLFSEEDTGSRVARTAMGNVPRDVRGGQLCSTELTEQLRHGSQRFNPDIIPAFKLPEGTVLDVRQAAFRSGAQWYDVRFRCEVNENATRVVSFGLDIGEPVPRSEWRARRFPEY